MINVNIPRTTTASFQPDYTKTAQFPGFVFYHSLKEWYFIYSQSNIQVYPDRLLDEQDLKGTFAFLIGNNANNIFVANCETARLGKLQVDPNTGAQIAFQFIDLKTIVQTELATSQDVLITGGYVNGNTVVILAAISLNAGAGLTNPQPYIIVSTDNGSTWDTRSMTLGVPTEDQIPVGITRISYYDTYYLAAIVRSYTTDNIYIYIGDEEEIVTNTDTLYYHQTVSVALSTFNTDRRIHINRQVNWNHNSIHFLNDDRTRVIRASTTLHSTGTYETPYPIPPFEFTFDNAAGGSSFTQIQPILDNTSFTSSTTNYTKLDIIGNGATENFATQSYEQGIIWDEISNDLAITDATVVDFRALNDDIILFGIQDNGGNSQPFVQKGGLINTDPTVTTILDSISMDRFNTGGQHWDGELVTPVPAAWLPNDATSQWISLDADTDLIDYGAAPFDYTLTLNIDVPEDLTLTGDLYYDDEILDIIVDGVSTGNNLTTTAVVTAVPIALVLTRGPHTINFNIRNSGIAGAGNPTGIRIVWDPITVGNNGAESPDFKADFSDMFVDVDEDRLYLSLERSAWILELSTLNIIAYLDLHAEPLVFNAPFPPGYDPLVITGVTDDTHVPIRWKWVKNFNDVYIYNSYHDNTFFDINDKEFYMWVVDDEDPSYHTMFSAFDLAQTLIMKLEYFYDINNELHIIILKDDAGFNRTFQYRLNGLAQFNQLTQGEVLAGTFSFSNVYVDREGAVILTESDEPNYASAQNTIFVYKNPNAADLSAGAYIIEVDDAINAFDATGADQVFVEPPQHDGVHPEYWSKSLTYTEVPGDYISKVFLNADDFRDQANNVLGFDYGEVINSSAQNDITIANEQILKADTDPQIHWTYFLTFDDVNFKHRLFRARAVFYPST